MAADDSGSDVELTSMSGRATEAKHTAPAVLPAKQNSMIKTFLPPLCLQSVNRFLAFQLCALLQAFDLQALVQQNARLVDEPRRPKARANPKASAAPTQEDNSWTGKEGVQGTQSLKPLHF